MHDVWKKYYNHDHRDDHEAQYDVFTPSDTKKNRNALLPYNQIAF